MVAARGLIPVALIGMLLLAGGCEEQPALAERAPTPLAVPPADPQEIQAAIDRGVAFLLEAQWQDGSWGSAKAKDYNVLCPVPGGHWSFKTGTTSLCIMALVEAGGDCPGVDEAIGRAEQWLVDNLRKVRRDSLETLYNNWAHAYSIRAILRLLQRPGLTDDRRAELRELVDLQIHLLAKMQSLTGGWGYYHRGEMHSSPPSLVATTFMTATVLIALHEAAEAGFDVPEAVSMLAMRAIRNSRNPNFTYDYYSHPVLRMPLSGLSRPPGSLARSQACNAAMYLWGDRPTNLNIIRAWLDRLYARNGWLDVARKTYNPHESYYAVSGYFYYYGHYYAGICMDLLPVDERPYHQDHLVNLLLPKQETDGSWWDFMVYRYHQEYGTAFALMTLQRCLPKEPAESSAQ